MSNLQKKKKKKSKPYLKPVSLFVCNLCRGHIVCTNIYIFYIYNIISCVFIWQLSMRIYECVCVCASLYHTSYDICLIIGIIRNNKQFNTNTTHVISREHLLAHMEGVGEGIIVIIIISKPLYTSSQRVIIVRQSLDLDVSSLYDIILCVCACVAHTPLNRFTHHTHTHMHTLIHQ